MHLTNLKGFLKALTRINKKSRNFLLTHIALWLYYVDLLTRIPKSHHLLFYKFSTIYYDFPKFCRLYAYKEKEKEKRFFSLGSLKISLIYPQINLYYSYESCTMHLTRWKTFYSRANSILFFFSTPEQGRPAFDQLRRRWWRAATGKDWMGLNVPRPLLGQW